MKVFIWTNINVPTYAWKHGVLFYKEAKRQGLNVAFGKDIEKIEEYNPDWVFLIGRGRATHANIDYISKKFNLIVWDPDEDRKNSAKNKLVFIRRRAKITFSTILGVAERNHNKDNKFLFIPPHCSDEYYKTALKRLDSNYKIRDLCFLGNGGEGRSRILQSLIEKEHFKLMIGGERVFHYLRKYSDHHRRGEDAASLYATSKICLGLRRTGFSRKGSGGAFSVSSRMFEVMGCGGFYLSDEIERMEEVGFKEGIHLVTCKDYKELVDKIKYYLKHDEEREKIAKAGQDLVLEKHTLTVRIKQFWEIMSAYPDNVGWEIPFK